MARPVNDVNRELVQARILEAARMVFCKKGFIDVTMTDLINAAGLSRGGFYFYYKSVGEVFLAAVRKHRDSKFSEIRKSVEDNPDFYELMDSYLEKQKVRLLQNDTSMLLALYEYLFTNRKKSDVQFRLEQKNNVLDTINTILQLGITQGAIDGEGIDRIAEHFMYTIEGLNAVALIGGLNAEAIDQQFTILKKMLKTKKGEN